jgi:hypothetical protein
MKNWGDLESIIGLVLTTESILRGNIGRLGGAAANWIVGDRAVSDRVILRDTRAVELTRAHNLLEMLLRSGIDCIELIAMIIKIMVQVGPRSPIYTQSSALLGCGYQPPGGW